MEQKRAMLYPDPSSIPSEHRSSAAAAIGLPIEVPPPSYDVATRDSLPRSNIGWTPSAPEANPANFPHSPPMEHQQHLPVIVDQPRYPQAPPQTQPMTFPNQPTVTQPGAVTTTVQTTPIISSKLGPNPSNVTCPACGASKISRMCYTPNSKTHLSAFILCLVGWCCCACIVPYCMNSCRTGNHYCSKCNTFLGAYNPKAHGR